MDYFILDPKQVGSKTSRIFDNYGFRPNENFLNYKSEKMKKKVIETCEKYKTKNRNLTRYYEEIEKLEPADIVVVATTDTVSLKPPRKRTDLPPMHPSNELIHKINKRLYQLELKGKSSYIAVLDPPYIPTALVPGMPRPRFPPSLKELYKPHKFSYWDSPEKQKEKHERDLERYALYSKENNEIKNYTVPGFDFSEEKLLLKGLEAVSTELLSKFIVEKCNDTWVSLIPHSSETKKNIKKGIVERVREKRPDLKGKDIVEKYIFTESYNIHNICASNVINSLTNYLGNRFCFKYEKWEKKSEEDKKVRFGRNAEICPYGSILCESAPKQGDRCRDEDGKDCMQVKLKEILKKHSDANKIKKYIEDKGIIVPSFLTIKKSLEFDLTGKLEPFEIPKMDDSVYDLRCSEISSVKDAFEYHLKRTGTLEPSENLNFLADVGKVCHELIYQSAPIEWKVAMERPGILFHEPKEGPLKGEEIRIHVTPDCAMLNKNSRQVVVNDWKTSLAPFKAWLPKSNHGLQVSGYNLYVEQNSELNSDYGVVLYMRDLQTRKSVITKLKTSKLKKKFIDKVERVVEKDRNWTDNPEIFVSEWEEMKRNFCSKCYGSCERAVELYKEKFL